MQQVRRAIGSFPTSNIGSAQLADFLAVSEPPSIGDEAAAFAEPKIDQCMPSQDKSCRGVIMSAVGLVHRFKQLAPLFRVLLRPIAALRGGDGELAALHIIRRQQLDNRLCAQTLKVNWRCSQSRRVRTHIANGTETGNVSYRHTISTSLVCAEFCSAFQRFSQV